MTFPVTKTAEHTVEVGDLVSTQVGDEFLFPTYLVSQNGSLISGVNALYVRPGVNSTWAVSASYLPLPDGAATEAKQDSTNSLLSTIVSQTDSIEGPLASLDTKITACNTGNVAIASSVLPTGASTEAKQDSTNSLLTTLVGQTDGVEGSLSSLDGKVTACNTGSVTIVSSSLPTGAATAANQATMVTSLSTLAAGVSASKYQIRNLNHATDSVTSKQEAGDSWAIKLLDSNGSNLSSTNDAFYGNVQIVRVCGGTHSIGTLGANSGVTIGAVEIVASQTIGLSAGTNAIGKLAANSGVDIGDVDVTSQPARVATTDTITAKLATDAIQNGTTALTPKFAVIAASSSGNNTLISAVTDKKIRVLAYNLIGNGAVNAKFQSGASGTDLTGLKYIAAAGGGICAPFNPVGWFETASNALLNLNLSGAVAVGGELVYVEV